jgi:hypothetical protein
MMRCEGHGTEALRRHPIIVIEVAIMMIVPAASSALAELFSEGPSLASSANDDHLEKIR